MLRKFYQYLHELTKATKEISEDVEEVKTEMSNFEAEINQKIEDINELLAEYDIKIERIRNELYTYVNGEIINLRNYVNAQDNLLNEKIRQIEIGNINIFDPTTGLYSPLQIVIDNLYDMNRANALTATEYDNLELSATEYDAYNLAARDYDINGKTLLV
jgi:predicted  nucleic acid-binding Zn-ribbon protein